MKQSKLRRVNRTSRARYSKFRKRRSKSKQGPPRHLTNEYKDALSIFAQSVGYTESDSLDLLQQALTHRSYVHEKAPKLDDNQRLEFLGDSALGLCISKILFEKYPTRAERDLHDARIKLVDTESLALIAESLGIESLLLIGNGENNLGLKARRSRLADALEAIIGTLLLDMGVEHTSQWIWSVFAPLHETREREHHLLHSKNVLIERFATTPSTQPEFKSIFNESNRTDAPWSTEIWLDQQLLGKATGISRQEAERTASAAALKVLDQRS